MNSKKGIIFTGAIIGILSAVLVKFGNPGNMGVCIACFLRDITGSLNLHSVEKLSYIRPEIIGIVLGAFIMSLVAKEFSPKGGSSPMTRFMLGFSVMIGALVFLGCPLRMILRLAGGDLNAIFGILGFTSGIGIGILFLNKGFTLNRNYKQTKMDGLILPIIIIGLLSLLLLKPLFITLSTSVHAPIILSLSIGLIVGVLAQKTRLCMVGGIRDLIMFKDSYLISGFISIIIFAFIGNIAFGQFNLGFIAQPAAHNDAVWNFLGMVIAGWGSVLLGGCPLRQLILSGEGNTDSSITIMGLIAGAAFAHNFGLAASGNGVPLNGKIAVIILAVFLLVTSILNTKNSDL